MRQGGQRAEPNRRPPSPSAAHNSEAVLKRPGFAEPKLVGY